MVPKHYIFDVLLAISFRAVLFRMVPKQVLRLGLSPCRFRAVLFRMVPKHIKSYSFFK